MLENLVLSAVAVAGDASDIALVAAIAELSEAETVAVLSRLEPPYADPGAGPGWLLGAHARACAVLASRGAPAAERAHHAEQAAAIGDQNALTTLVAAATEVSGTAPADAARWLELVLRHTPASGRNELRVWLANLYSALGRFEDCRTLLHETIGRLPAGASRAAAVALCAQVDRLLGRRRESAALVLREIETLPGDPSTFSGISGFSGSSASSASSGFSGGRVRLRLELAAATIGDGLPEADLAAACRLGDDPLRARALAMSAFGDLAAGAVSRRTYVRIAKAAALVDRLPDLTPEVLAWLAWCELLINRPADAVRHAERGLRLGGASLAAPLLHCLGVAHAVLGRLQAAVVTLEEAVALAARSSPARSHLCEVLIWMGESEAASQLAHGASEVGIQAAIRRLHGDFAGCVELLTGVGGGPSLPRFSPLRRGAYLVLLSEASAGLGLLDAAEQAALLALSSVPGLLFGRARLALAGARRSAPLAVEVAGRFERAGNLAEAAGAWLLAGKLSGDRSHLMRAKSLAASCGARLYFEAANRELRAPVELVGREREVAELVMAGCSNREIASRLFVSARTVEATLTRIYGKLGVPSRAALTAVLTSDR